MNGIIYIKDNLVVVFFILRGEVSFLILFKMVGNEIMKIVYSLRVFCNLLEYKLFYFGYVKLLVNVLIEKLILVFIEEVMLWFE